MTINRRVVLFSMVLFALAAFSLVSQQDISPPVASRLEHKEVRHGETIEDPYFWLREKTSPEVVKYLEAENAYTEVMTKELKPFQELLYKEMLGRICFIGIL